MSENKFTPGPWMAHYGWACYGRSEPDPEHPRWCEITGGDLEMSLTGHVGIANARLAAAAPDLLEAHDPNRAGPDFLDWLADRLVNVYGEYPNIDFVLTLRRRAELSRSAIAKATGSQP